MRTHCEIGYDMVIKIPFLREAAEIVLSHQEYFDGSGYPRGLRGEAIPLGARIFAVADALDAMISDRPYRKALPIEHARKEIQRCSGTQFDPEVVEMYSWLCPTRSGKKSCAKSVKEPYLPGPQLPSLQSPSNHPSFATLCRS